MSGTPAYLLPWYVRIPIAFRVATGYAQPFWSARMAWKRVVLKWKPRLRSAWFVLIGRPEPVAGAPPYGDRYWPSPEAYYNAVKDNPELKR